MKGTGWKSYNPREPVRTSGSYYPEQYKEARPKPMISLNSPSPEAFEHVWEEGSKRPKTQNEKCRRVTNPARNLPNTEIFPCKETNDGKLYEIPIIVIRDDKSRRVASAKRNGTSKTAKRPSTFKPGKSNLVTSLDQEFLELFEA
jgi:hypothetical protein